MAGEVDVLGVVSVFGLQNHRAFGHLEVFRLVPFLLVVARVQQVRERMVGALQFQSDVVAHRQNQIL